jgi:glyoxylase-like metal-dependent hydrolase (beta-lactamase superfamily II)
VCIAETPFPSYSVPPRRPTPTRAQGHERRRASHSPALLTLHENSENSCKGGGSASHRSVDGAGNLSWAIGDVVVTRVEESIAPVARDGGALVIGLTDDILTAERGWADPFFSRTKGHVLLSVHSFVVVDGDTTILVDTCVGPRDDQPMPGDPAFLDRLASAIDGGLDDVDVALCTHLHFDHVGWNTVLADGELVPTFPNARYLVSADELAALDGDETHVAGDVASYAIAPLRAAGVLDAVTTDHRLSPSVRLLSTPGHTPGHVSVLIESGGASALITGDVAHTPIQFARPEIVSQADVDPARATATRRALADRFADTPTLVLGTHFPPPTAGHLRVVDGRARLVT